MQVIDNGQCLICGGEMKFFLTGKDYLYRTSKKDFKIYKCTICGLERITPMPSSVELKNAYPEKYYSLNMVNNMGLLSKIKKSSIQINYACKNLAVKKLVAGAMNIFYYFGLPENFKEGSRALDIGCGDGYDVQLMRHCNWEAYGFEVGARGSLENVFYDSSLDLVDFGGMQFDLVRMWHSFEHMKDPRACLVVINSLMKENGFLVMAVPNTRSVAAWFFGKYYLGRDIPRHLFGYNDKNIVTLLAKNNFKVIKIRYQSLNGIAASISNLINEKFKTKLDWQGNFIWIALWLPLEYFISFARLSDQMSIVVTKELSE